MPEADAEISLEKAMAFFDRAKEVEKTNNFDYAIEMYLEGIRCFPDALEDGHIPLRRLALTRQGLGGKKPSVLEKVKHQGGKSPLEELLNAEYLLAKDPDNLTYAERMLKACVAGKYKRTAEWIADLIFEANKASEKPSLHIYTLLKDSYAAIEKFAKAVAACNAAHQMRPDDAALEQELRNLSAQLAVQNGKYDQGSNFTVSVRDRDRQLLLHAQQQQFKTEDFKREAIEQARAELAEDPDSAEKVLKLVDALYESGLPEDFQEAIELLEKKWQESSDFIYKKRQGELKIKKIRQEIRKLKSEAEKGGDSSELRAKLGVLRENLLKTELEHYKLCVENYPTDLLMKYEYALRLIQNRQYDEAIPLLQEARKDPRRKIHAMDEIGLCFFLKGWYADAIDIFTEAFEMCQVKDDEVAKDIRYNLARSYEEDGQKEKALEIFRKLAQIDFAYKDVKDRVDKLRKMSKN